MELVMFKERAKGMDTESENETAAVWERAGVMRKEN